MIVFSSQIFGLITHNAGLCVVVRLIFDYSTDKVHKKEKHEERSIWHTRQNGFIGLVGVDPYSYDRGSL